MSRRSSRRRAESAEDSPEAVIGETDAGAASAVEHPAGRHLAGTPRHRGLKLTAAVLASLLVAGFAFVAVQVLRLQSNVQTAELNLGENQESALPVDSSTDPLQILIIGSDTRTGNSGAFLGDETESSGEGNADVMMLLTLSADRENVTVVSFPRDLLTPLPRCTDPRGGAPSEAVDLGQLNGSLKSGGPGCTVAAINKVTGLSIDHFMMAGFSAVSELSSAVGGVEVCVQEPVDDEYSGLRLPAGTSEVEGDQALAFLRTRHSFGDGGDTGRIAAQQSFLASLARKVRAEGTLTNLPKLYSIADVVTRNLTVDPGLSQPAELLKIADRLKDVDLGQVAFVTVPTEPYVEDPNRLVLDDDAAEPLFEAIREDRGLTEEPTATAAPTPGSAPAPSAPSAPAVAPASVPVIVVNGTADPSRAGQVQQLLLDAGYEQAVPQEAPPAAASQIYFGQGFDGAAADLAALLGIPGDQVGFDPTATGLELLVGADFTTGTRIVVPPLGSDLQGQTAEQVTCQASSGL
jgi:LCP family protein required for cell wall assembly